MKTITKPITPAPTPRNLVAAGVLALAAFNAQATCSQTQGTTCPPVPAPTPIPSPSPSPTPAPAPVYNGGNGGNATSGAVSTSGAIAGAISGSSSTSTSGATSGSVSGVKTGDIGSNSNAAVKTGNIGSTSGVKTGDIGSTSAVKTGDIGSSSSAKTGDVNLDGSNNSSYSSVYKAAAGSAISSGAGTQGHGCFRGKGGVSFGIQTVAAGGSVTIGGGEEYETTKVKATDADGKEIEIDANRCAIDQVNLATIAAGATPYATDAQIAMGAQTAAEASPDAARAMKQVMSNDNLVNRFARKATVVAAAPAPAPTTNLYNTTIIDKSGVATNFTCPKGTKIVLDANQIPVIDKATNLPVCQPG